LYADIENLLKEYTTRSKNVQVEMVDPNRDQGRAKQLRDQYELSEANVVVFSYGDRRVYLTEKDIGEYSKAQKSILGSKPAKRIGFNGEGVFTSAIMEVINPEKPVVYFLAGHGERDIEVFDESSMGYSYVAKVLLRDHLDVRKLQLSAEGVPADCAALIVAGPQVELSSVEVEALRQYLANGGAMLVALDLLRKTGLEPLLAEWGVIVAKDFVVDPKKTRFEGEVYVTQYAEHPITRKLDGTASVFIRPRAIVPLKVPAKDGENPEDKPRFTHLASCSPEGWAESDMQQSPPVYDPESDTKGAICIAAAVEKGGLAVKSPDTGEVDLALDSTRLVVLGDSQFASNKVRAGGSLVFFLNAVNWLIERDELIAIPPKPIEEMKIVMETWDLNKLILAATVGLPGMVAILGAMVWSRRRR
jgi:ABC-type uncharacterized transport system involved in gliding motility auxiliary subunit